MTSIGFIGAGAMASALIKGVLSAKVISADKVFVSDKNSAALAALQSETGVSTSEDNAETVRRSQIIMLAVKPNIIPYVMKDIKEWVTKDHLIVSVAAGTTIGAIEAMLPSHAKVVRVMPNTPALVGAMASAFALGKNATAADGAVVQQILGSCGVAHQLPEYNMDAVTGVSGSGPAYIFILIEALADGGVRAGLPRKVAANLAAQTVFGAAKMVLETGLDPAVLKNNVASPGGTTITGIHALEQGGFRGTIMNAVLATANKSKELGAPKSKL